MPSTRLRRSFCFASALRAINPSFMLYSLGGYARLLIRQLVLSPLQREKVEGRPSYGSMTFTVPGYTTIGDYCCIPCINKSRAESLPPLSSLPQNSHYSFFLPLCNRWERNKKPDFVGAEVEPLRSVHLRDVCVRRSKIVYTYDEMQQQLTGGFPSPVRA